jgi:D-arabinose 1-dehydrogenase-like Zn-dependent alcohol dehydrogenase
MRSGRGARLPDKIGAVMETVGAANRTHSIICLRSGRTVVICGATSGDAPSKAERTKICFRQLKVIGSTIGSRPELERLVRFLEDHGIEPAVDSVHSLADARDGVRPDRRRRRVRQRRHHGGLTVATSIRATPRG